MTNKKKPTAREQSAYKKTTPKVYDNIPPLHIAISAFQTFALSEGFGNIEIKADGLVHRFRPEGQRKGKNGYYCVYPDGYPAGYIGDFKNDRYLTWHYKSDKPINPKQQAEIKRNMQKMREKRLADQQARYAQGRVTANNVWNRGIPASSEHPYLVKKHCEGLAKYLRQDAKGNLIVPLYKNKRLVGIQYISPHGSKFFSKNTELKGSYFVIGDLKKSFDSVYVSEGASSGHSIHILANNAPVFIAMNANNLEPVACAIRKKWADVSVIIACDNDVREDKDAINIGVDCANKAALACGGRVSIPQMPDNSKCDWNDLYCLALDSEGADNDK